MWRTGECVLYQKYFSSMPVQWSRIQVPSILWACHSLRLCLLCIHQAEDEWGREEKAHLLHLLLQMLARKWYVSLLLTAHWRKLVTLAPPRGKRSCHLWLGSPLSVVTYSMKKRCANCGDSWLSQTWQTACSFSHVDFLLMSLIKSWN